MSSTVWAVRGGAHLASRDLYIPLSQGRTMLRLARRTRWLSATDPSVCAPGLEYALPVESRIQ
jgi:hypothetical protein